MAICLELYFLRDWPISSGISICISFFNRSMQRSLSKQTQANFIQVQPGSRACGLWLVPSRGRRACRSRPEEIYLDYNRNYR